MLRHLSISLIIGILLATSAFSQNQSVNSQSETDKSIDALLATIVEDFTRGFVEGFNNSTETQIAVFELQTNDRKDLSKSEKVATNAEFRKSFSGTMERVRNRVLTELKIAETFKAKLADYYRANYSEEELVKLAEFMSTSLGKKVLQNQTKFAQLAHDFSRSIVTDKRFIEIVNDESAKKVTSQQTSN